VLGERRREAVQIPLEQRTSLTAFGAASRLTCGRPSSTSMRSTKVGKRVMSRMIGRWLCPPNPLRRVRT
jgi:hypothetical protein